MGCVSCGNGHHAGLRLSFCNTRRELHAVGRLANGCDLHCNALDGDQDTVSLYSRGLIQLCFGDTPFDGLAAGPVWACFKGRGPVGLANLVEELLLLFLYSLGLLERLEVLWCATNKFHVVVIELGACHPSKCEDNVGSLLTEDEVSECGERLTLYVFFVHLDNHVIYPDHAGPAAKGFSRETKIRLFAVLPYSESKGKLTDLLSLLQQYWRRRLLQLLALAEKICPRPPFLSNPINRNESTFQTKLCRTKLHHPSHCSVEGLHWIHEIRGNREHLNLQSCLKSAADYCPHYF